MSSSHSKRPALKRRRVLLVDDHPLMREAIAHWINREPDLEVCDQASNIAEALNVLSLRRPDIVVTDLSMSGRNGLELIKDVHAIYSDLPILVLSMHNEALHATHALRAGASGYIMKDDGEVSLATAVRHVLRGGLYVTPRILRAVTKRKLRDVPAPFEQLSEREFEVFELIGGGNDSRKIAGQLHISSRVADAHRAKIKQKLGLASSSALLLRATHWFAMEQSGLRDS